MFTMDDWVGLVILMVGIALLLALIVNVVIQMWRASRALLVIWRASRKVRTMPMPVAKCVICGALHFDDGKSCDCKPIFAGDPPCDEHEFPPGPHRTKACLKCGATMWMTECKNPLFKGDQP